MYLTFFYVLITASSCGQINTMSQQPRNSFGDRCFYPCFPYHFLGCTIYHASLQVPSFLLFCDPIWEGFTALRRLGVRVVGDVLEIQLKPHCEFLTICLPNPVFRETRMTLWLPIAECLHCNLLDRH